MILRKIYQHESFSFTPMFLCMHTQLCTTLYYPMDLSPPDFSVHGISQARIVKWVAISSSRGSSRSRDQTCISCFGRWILCHWATWTSLCHFKVPSNLTSTLNNLPFSIDKTVELVYTHNLYSVSHITSN